MDGGFVAYQVCLAGEIEGGAGGDVAFPRSVTRMVNRGALGAFASTWVFATPARQPHVRISLSSSTNKRTNV
jgi:hypothetical protein